MSEQQQESDIGEARGLRNEAWALVRSDIAELREGLNGRAIANRLKDRATSEVVEAIDQAREVASENKAVVAGTVLALVGWFLREPIATVFARLLGFDETGEGQAEHDDAANDAANGDI